MEMFKLGKVVLTQNANQTIDKQSVANALQRHHKGDWGDLCDENKQRNDEALKHCDRLFSAYRDKNGIKFWIITEHDRSYTTILLPEDY
jgi:hypothetical protein